MLAVSPAGAAAVKLFEGSFEDHYHDPGRPFEVINAAGKAIVQITPDGSGLFLHAQGASPEGDQPFVSILSLANADVESEHSGGEVGAGVAIGSAVF